MSAKIAGPLAVVDGKTIGEWSQNWLSWVVKASAPVADPFGAFDADTQSQLWRNGSVDQSGPVFFLAGGKWGKPDPTTQAAVNAEPRINVPAGKDILVPLVNTIDVENNGDPNISTISTWKAETGASYAAEAKYIAAYGNTVVTDAHLSLAKASDPTHPILSLNWPTSELYAADSGVFPIHNISAASYVGSFGLGITDLPYSDVAGRWAMITDLPKGNYVLDFGGSRAAVHDIFASGTPVIPALPRTTIDTTEVLHVA